jgi:hypothetical protein
MKITMIAVATMLATIALAAAAEIEMKTERGGIEKRYVPGAVHKDPAKVEQNRQRREDREESEKDVHNMVRKKFGLPPE